MADKYKGKSQRKQEDLSRKHASEGLGASLIMGDVTEHKRTIEALQKSEARIRSIIDTAVDAIFAINQQGIIHMVNLAAERIFGYRSEELIGRNISILMPEPYQSEHDDYLRKYILTGHAKIIGIGREVIARKKDGTVFPIDLAVSELRFGDQRIFTGIIRDITQRKRAEQRLAAEHAVTRVLAGSDSLQEATSRILQALCQNLGWDIGEFFVLDKTDHNLHCVEFWNSPSGRMTEFERFTRKNVFPIGVELPGRVWASGKTEWIADVFTEANFPRAEVSVREGLHRALGFPIRFGEEIIGVMDFFSREIQPPDEELLHMFASVGSQIGQFIGRKRAEEQVEQHSQQLKLFEEKLRQAEKLMIIGMIASEIAHEVGTPLNIISGRVELLSEREKSNERIRKDLEVINQQIDRITKIIRKQLDLTRRRRGRTEEVNLRQLLSSLVDFLHLQTEKANIQVDFSVENGLNIHGDEDQLQQVFLNILMNAIQAMNRAGNLSVRSLRHVKDSVSYVEIVIQDTGQGIPPENMDKIFDPFFSTKQDKGGSGLGLSVALDIVKRHGGEILVESEVNHGTTFHIWLPVSGPESKN